MLADEEENDAVEAPTADTAAHFLGPDYLKQFVTCLNWNMCFGSLCSQWIRCSVFYSIEN